ncbi:class II aldolase [Bradyrhizobium sp. 38]|nr:class II aldolase [Bradyrhizobium sp. 38]MCK1780403.1 class II aldolase [Bradyrhizobium sp. 132]
MTDTADSEMRDLLALAARLGRDPLLIQGPGGNISLKRDGVMWVKASGTWMAEAMERRILIPIDVAAVLDGLAAGDPACETCEQFMRRDLSDLTLRPSIETTLHAVMPQRVVVHVHCVETIASACLSDAAERLAAPLSRLNWSFVPYVRPGASLGRAMAKHLDARTNVVVLGKHGLVVAADSVAEAERLRADVSQRLARTARIVPAPDRERLQAVASDGYSIPDDGSWHAIATDPVNLSAARSGSLYPDHVVFLGPGIVTTEARERAVDATRRCGRIGVPLVVVPGAGILVHEAATPAARALIRCLADVTSRLETGNPIAPLSVDEEAQLLNWDPEKYRRSLDARIP